MKRTHLFAMIFASIVLASGCGPSTTDVKGVVKLDGKPVKGATVTFVSDDGKRSYSGFTDGEGNFTLVSGNNKSGVASGTYKVTVVKGPDVPASVDPSSPDAMKAMQQGSKAGANADSKRKGPGGILMPPAFGRRRRRNQECIARHLCNRQINTNFHQDSARHPTDTDRPQVRPLSCPRPSVLKRNRQAIWRFRDWLWLNSGESSYRPAWRMTILRPIPS